MTTALIKKQMTLAISCALVVGMAASAARAESDPKERQYLTDQRGTVVKSGFGLCWHSGFGPAPAPTAECDPDFVPAPVAKVEPAPKMAAVAVPQPAPKPASQRVTLDADTLFDFDKATLRPAGRQALDEFIDKTKDISPEVILAVGHADRFGSEAYNQRLSQQRAAAVKTYLLGKGIEANRIQTDGKGEMQPVTKAGDCTGAKSAKVIACLQPDRRVDVEIVGTQTVR
ncbi:MAG: OmpA family protein [Rhodocyclaceae bacterium]|nr:OmpA family protein [Rhodocyclaceae bacterium]